MKTQLTCIFITLIFLFVLLPSAFAQTVGLFPADDEWFSLAIEQNGKPVAVVNNKVELEKAPFTLVLVLRGPIGVLVNFSVSDVLFKGFLKNKRLAEFVSRPDYFMGIGEGEGNFDELILIDKISPHYMFYADDSAHRFSSIELQEKFIIGRRIISNFTTYADEFAPSPIEELSEDTLYISVMYGEWDQNYNKIELQKDALRGDV